MWNNKTVSTVKDFPPAEQNDHRKQKRLEAKTQSTRPKLYRIASYIAKLLGKKRSEKSIYAITVNLHLANKFSTGGSASMARPWVAPDSRGDKTCGQIYLSLANRKELPSKRKLLAWLDDGHTKKNAYNVSIWRHEIVLIYFYKWKSV